MLNKLVLTNHAIFSVKTVSNFIVFLVFCLFGSGCETITVLKDSALYSCGTSTVYLSGWWSNVQDKSAISVDPIGGYQFVYWLDDAGNVCHGNPGSNGQPGPVVINAYKPQAYALAGNGSSITTAQLNAFQKIPVFLNNYAGSGLHFAQFYNTLWRTRANGKTYQIRLDGMSSIPNVIEVGNKSCIAPVAFSTEMMAFIPSLLSSSTAQSSDKCKVRAMPVALILSEKERKGYDVSNLPHGNEVYEVP